MFYFSLIFKPIDNVVEGEQLKLQPSQANRVLLNCEPSFAEQSTKRGY